MSGSVRGSSCREKVTWPWRWPKRVPVSLRRRVMRERALRRWRKKRKREWRREEGL